MWSSNRWAAWCRGCVRSAMGMRLWWVGAWLLAGLCQQAQAQSFGACDARMFLDQSDSPPTVTTLQTVDYSSAPFTYSPQGSGTARNGIGYNPLDNFIYGVQWIGGNGNVLVRVAADGSSTSLGVISGVPLSNHNNGVISPAGDYYIKSGFLGTTLYRVDLATRVATPITLSQAVAFADLAWHNNRLYAIDGSTNRLISIDPATGTVTSFGSTIS